MKNVKNEWSNSIDASKVEGAVRSIEVEEVWCANGLYETWESKWPSRVATEGGWG